MKVSNCCGARVIGEVDPMCSECKEHCEVVDLDCSLSMNKPNSVNRKPLNPDNSLDMLISTLESVLEINQLSELCNFLNLTECCKLWNYSIYDNTGDTDCQTCPFYSYNSLGEVIEKLRGMR